MKTFNIKENELKKIIIESVKKHIIKENLETEGGNAISQAEPIRGDIAGKIARDIINKLETTLHIEARPMGSTGKKRADQTSGDIDIAVGLPLEDVDTLRIFVRKNFGEVEEYFNKNFRLYSIGFPYMEDGTKKIAQVDFTFSKNLDLTTFGHHSPDYTKNESKFKGAFRTILLKNIIGKVPLDKEKFPTELYTENDYDGTYAGQPKTWWKLTYDLDDGLQIVHRTNKGVRKALKSDKRIPQDTIFITSDINKIIKIGLGEQATINDCNSFESLVDFIFSGRYKFASQEMIEKIFTNFFNDSSVIKFPQMAEGMKNYVAQVASENGVKIPGINIQ